MPTSTSIVLPRMMLVILSVIFGLVVADGVITNYLIRHGLAWEWNPFLKDYVGTSALLLIKALASLLCVTVLWFLYKRSPKLTGVCSIAICGFYTMVVYWNIGAAVSAYL